MPPSDDQVHRDLWPGVLAWEILTEDMVLIGYLYLQTAILMENDDLIIPPVFGVPSGKLT